MSLHGTTKAPQLCFSAGSAVALLPSCCLASAPQLCSFWRACGLRYGFSRCAVPAMLQPGSTRLAHCTFTHGGVSLKGSCQDISFLTSQSDRGSWHGQLLQGRAAVGRAGSVPGGDQGSPAWQMALAVPGLTVPASDALPLWLATAAALLVHEVRHMLPSGSGSASLALCLSLVVVATLQHGWPPLNSCCARGLLALLPSLRLGAAATGFFTAFRELGLHL